MNFVIVTIFIDSDNKMIYNEIIAHLDGGESLIGLEYILHLYDVKHIELAELLGIKKQNINLWIKGKQGIPKKYLPILEERFRINHEYFTKELSEIEKLEIQSVKLKDELKPVIERHHEEFALGEENKMVKKAIYDQEPVNRIERDIEKAKLVDVFSRSLHLVDEHPYLETYKILVEILEKAQGEPLLHKTIEALAHYFEVLPNWVSKGEEQDEFEEEIFEVFDDHNY